MTNKVYIGVDPGAHGALMCLNPMGGIDMHMERKGTGDGYNTLAIEEVITYVRTLMDAHGPALRVGLENPRSMPTDTPVTAYQLGHQVGQLCMMFHVLGVNYTLIPPITWCRKLGFPGKQYDNAVAIRAAWLDERYPSARVAYTGPRGGLLDGRIDALCIASYLKQVDGPLGKFGGRRPPAFRGGGFSVDPA